MKVSSTPPSSASGSSGAARSSGEGFRLPAVDGVSPRAPVSSAGASSGVTGVSALLALQSVGGPEARNRALRKGGKLLDALDRLQVALLGEGPTRGNLAQLKAALTEERAPSGDLDLDRTLDWAEVRAAVEAAKLERAAGVV